MPCLVFLWLPNRIGYYFFRLVKKSFMTQNKIFKGQRDRSRIDVNDPIDVEYVHHQFPWLSYDEIKDAIKKHGPDREAVQAVLQGTGAQDDE
jgi:hypothetical protein